MAYDPLEQLCMEEAMRTAVDLGYSLIADRSTMKDAYPLIRVVRGDESEAYSSFDPKVIDAFVRGVAEGLR